MSYSVQAYLTDSARLRKAYGSKDEAVLAALSDALSGELDELDGYFESDANGHQNAQAVLADIVNGEVRFPKLAFLYGYVYEKLCEHYGGRIVPPGEEYSTNYYWDIPKQVYKAFIPIPFSEDFPEIYSIPVSELQAEKERFLSPTQRKGMDEASLAMEKEDFEHAFGLAIETKQDLVFFLY